MDMLELLGDRLLATSLQTVALTALVWLLCRFVRRLPASTQCTLWWLVALQAVVGLFWAAPLHLPVLPSPDAAPLVAQAAAVPVAAANASAPIIVMTPLPVDSGWSWLQVVMVVWLAGVLVMALRTFGAWRASRALLRHAQPCRDHKLNMALQLASEAHGLRRAPRLMLSTSVDSPQLVGPWRPVLLLPARGMQRMGDDALDMALTHELVHLQRNDLWWGLVPALAQHLFFFHPLVHLAAREYGIAREAAVDAAVVAGDRHCRQHYGRLLVQLGVAPRPGAGLASASPTFLSLKRRLLMLQNTSTFPRIGAGLILAAVALVGVVPLRLVAMPVPPAPPAPATVPVPPAPPAPAAGKPVTHTHTVTRINGKVVDMPVPPVPPAPPAVASPRAPAAPPAPPASPAPPVDGRSYARITIDTDNMHTRGRSTGDAHVLIYDDAVTMNGSGADLKYAETLDDGRGVLWFRHDGRAYVVREAATMSRFRGLFEETLRLGEAQAKLGARQGQLGERQGRMGERMGEIGERIGAIAERQARLAMARDDSAAARKASEDARREIEKLQAEMDNASVRADMEGLAKQQAELGLQQAELGKQQAAASARASAEATRMIEQTIRSGLAQQVKS